MDELTLTRITLDIDKIGSSVHISPEVLANIEVFFSPGDEFLQRASISAVRSVALWRPQAMLSVPATWWDQWKHQHRTGRFAWVARRFPPRMDCHEAVVYLPDFPIPEFRGRPVMQVAGWRT